MPGRAGLVAYRIDYMQNGRYRNRGLCPQSGRGKKQACQQYDGQLHEGAKINKLLPGPGFFYTN